MKSGKYVVRGALASGVLLFSCASNAQSNVTLYGVLDAGITYFSNLGGHSSWQQTNGVDLPSSWGLTGSEDLGAGNRAIFKMESAFKLNTGGIGGNTTGSAFFTKESYVGLSNKDMGTIRLGRIRLYTVEVAPYVGANGMIFGFHPGNFDLVVQSFFNNTVAYDSPAFKGFQFGAMYSFGSSTAPVTNTGRAYGFRLQYNHGPFQAQATMENANGVTINPANNGLPSAFGRSAASTIATGIPLDNLTTTSSDISYKFGQLQVIGVYSYTRMKAFNVVEKLQTGEVEALYNITPSLIAGAGYDYSIGMGGRWHIFDANLKYSLSKTTLLYLDAAFERVSGAGQKAALLYLQPSSNEHQYAISVGIRKFF
jgi:outer membrane protein OmpU